MRDEEFHTAVTELLGDWGATVAAPEVEAVSIVAPERDVVAVHLREYLDRMGMPSGWHLPDSPRGQEVLARLDGPADLPVIEALGKEPTPVRSVRELAATLFGSPDEVEIEELVDVCIVGAGPAGLAAAVYAASEGLSTVVLECEAIGGQAGTSSMIRNYLGFPRGVSGMRLAQRARNQALRFGTRFVTGWDAEDLVPERLGHHRVRTDGGDVRARTVVLATGVDYRRLGVPEVEDLVGRGVHYGSAMSAARELQGEHVVVVGGGNSAGQAAVHLARFAASVTVLVRRHDLASTMSQYLIGEIAENPRIRVEPRRAVVGARGDGVLESLTVRDLDSGEEHQVLARGLFLLLGAAPRTGWLPDHLLRDDHGFVLTGRDLPQETWHGDLPPVGPATSVPGVYAVGDVRAGSMKRVAAATGEGASVVPHIHAHLAARA